MRAVLACILVFGAFGLQFSQYRPSDSTHAYKSFGCQSAVKTERERFLNLWLANIHVEPAPLAFASIEIQKPGGSNMIFISPKYGLAYVANQKVASASFGWAFSHFKKLDDSYELFYVPYSSYGGKPLREDASPVSIDVVKQKLDGKVVFTFVRDPLGTAYSAYKEVSHRRTKFTHGDIVNMPCDAGDSRYHAYLQALQNASVHYVETFHSWPQAVKTDVLATLGRSSFDFIGRFENLEEDLITVFKISRSKLRQPPSDFEDVFQRFSQILLENKITHARGMQCDDQIVATGSVDGLANPETCKLACEIYAVDFQCFDYPRPSCCK